MNVYLILNDRAGSLAKEKKGLTAGSLLAALRQAGFTVICQHAANADLESVRREARSRRPDAVLVGGGDGTASAVAGRFVGSGIPLGILPLGTLNHFARDLGIPVDWREAVTALARAPIRSVDVGEVNTHIFINNCSIGGYAEAVRKRDALRQNHRRGKWPAMAAASFAVFLRLKRLRLRLDADGKSSNIRTPFALVANNRYSGRIFDPSLRPRLDEGRLWLYTTRAHRHAALLRLAWQTLLRRVDAADALDLYPFFDATLDATSAPLAVAADGEPVDLRLPLRFRCRPGALQVLSPSSA